MLKSQEGRRPPRVLHVTEATEAGVATFVATVSRVEPDCSVLLLRWRTPTDALETTVRENGARVFVLPLSRAWKRVPALRRLVRNHDVVMLHSGVAGLLGRGAAWMRLIRPRRLIYAPHLSMGYLNGCWRLAERILTRFARPQWLMLVSKSERRHFLADFAGGSRIGTSVLFPWIAPAGEASAVAAPTSQSLRLVSIGRISAQKAPLQLAEFLNCLDEGGIRAQFRWIGDGPLRGEFLRALSPSVATRTSISGWIRDIPEEVRTFEPHFYLNLSLREGFSIAAMEAMAMGLPVIASPVQGNEDLVVSGGNGFFYRPQKRDEFLARFRSALDDDAYGALCQGALATVARFNEEAFLDAYRTMLADVVDKRARSDGE